MNSRNEGLLSKDHLTALAEPFGLRPEEVQFLRYSQNHVYACEQQGMKTILRISEGRHRTRAQIESELAWMTFLRGHGLKVCRPIPAMNGEACVARQLDGREYIATCLEHVPGSPITPQELTPDLHAQLGHLLGKMHALSASHSHSTPAAAAIAVAVAARPHWYESRLLLADRESLGESLAHRFNESVDELISQLRGCPETPETYGLIHGDVSFGNCHLHEGGLWLFDFDNCEHGYFMQDIATVLYDSIYCKVLNKFADPGLTDRMVPRWTAFWEGYAAARPASSPDPALFKKFFLLREAIIYIHYHRVLDTRTLNDSFRSGLEVMRTNVENQEHQVDFMQMLGR